MALDINGGLERFSDSGLADGRAKPSDLRGTAGKAQRTERHTAGVVPDHVYSPAFRQSLIAERAHTFEPTRAGHQAGAVAATVN